MARKQPIFEVPMEFTPLIAKQNQYVITIEQAQFMRYGQKT